MKYTIGIELGVKNIVAGILDKNGKLIRRDTVPTNKDREFQEIIKDVCALIRKITADEDIEIKNIKYIGVGCPGVTDNKRGIVLKNYSLNFTNAHVRNEIQKHINLPVFVENDANCVAIAEYLLGAAYGTESSLTIKVGVGIGGGIIIDGSIYNGFNFGGTEFGHMVIEYNGRPCSCGRKGCWEQYVSGSSLINQTKQLAAENPDSILGKMVMNNVAQITELTIFEAAKAGDEKAKKLCSEFVEYFAEGLTNIVNILMPEVVIIAGPISKLGNAIVNPLVELLKDRIYSKELNLPEFKMAEMGNAGIVVGAAMLGSFKDEKLDDLV
ncbi:ROK family protein [Clostridium sp. BNL1100]|uniref:ROK family protein n=1 Tax=Clostridium sp. BNL1100 TaxID=755731 RepID=UPI00024A74D3|nr:ROK family protein [Clostridium sp. BNL1100]AEY65988.1 transcriptional regulator/sugar kinase [Clostridium sp. BNL1100]